jgi:uncharacterized protein YmfQ (DUF2313 family)
MLGFSSISETPISALPGEDNGGAATVPACLVPVLTPPAFSALTADDFSRATLALLPRGRAWPRRPGTWLAALCAAIGDCLFSIHAYCVLLLDTESDPAKTTLLLPEWEDDFGLPDSCSSASQTVAERQSALLAKIAASPGGQSATYFTSVSQALGYTITITTFDLFTFDKTPFGSPLLMPGWRFAWRVTAPSAASDLACRLSKLAPAYGVLLFQYSD